MGSTKHEKSFVNFDKTYEKNTIGMRGIIYFAVGLLLLIVITFGLMFALLNVMEDQQAELKGSTNPLLLSERERLPPEPRLQAAPGFGVDSPNGRVNLELKAPQSEWWERQKQYRELWEKGQTAVGADGKQTVVTLPIDAAKEKLLQQSEQAVASGGEKAGGETIQESRMFVSDSSAGRLPSETRR